MVCRTAPAWRGSIAQSLAFLMLFALQGGAAKADSLRLQPWAGPAPAFSLADSRGATIGLRPGSGEITIVHFFATWCEPCREELPALSRLAQRAGAAARVIAISVAEPEMRVRRFLATTQTDFPVLLDPDRATARAWGVSVLPTSFVLDAALAPRLAAEESVAWDEVQPHLLATGFKAGATAQK